MVSFSVTIVGGQKSEFAVASLSMSNKPVSYSRQNGCEKEEKIVTCCLRMKLN